MCCEVDLLAPSLPMAAHNPCCGRAEVGAVLTGGDLMSDVDMPAPALTVVIPSLNERGNVKGLVKGLTGAPDGVQAEILYIDDSTEPRAASPPRSAPSPPEGEGQ